MEDLRDFGDPCRTRIANKQTEPTLAFIVRVLD